jgi:hypothetical protein
MTRLRAIQGALLGVFLSWPLAPAGAAPQVLGLVASAEPQPLVCRDGACSLYLSSFCILERRAPPEPGTAYAPAPAQGSAEGAAMTLVLTRADGARLRLPAAGHLSFTSYGGYASVRASLPEAELARLGGVAAALEVGARATLVPEPVPGDPDPLDAAEIALATGPWREAAARFFDPGAETERAQAARLAGLLINALPERGRADARAREGLWARLAAAGAIEGVDPGAVARARTAYGVCKGFTRGSLQKPLRQCLETRHDAWMMDLNQAYWDELVGW